MTILAESPPTPTCNAPKNRAQELRQRIDESLETLAKAVDEVRASDMFRR